MVISGWISASMSSGRPSSQARLIVARASVTLSESVGMIRELPSSELLDRSCKQATSPFRDMSASDKIRSGQRQKSEICMGSTSQVSLGGTMTIPPILKRELVAVRGGEANRGVGRSSRPRYSRSF